MALGRAGSFVPGAAPDDLDGLAQVQQPGFEQVVEVGELAQRRIVRGVLRRITGCVRMTG
ncbi:hypothetical protein CA983_02995 [Streptomyces swartbergensis]|uniref:Uncharacterized protein n=1 Tax=Streptomyces swartbergensis TaxID=487165 RepID=A0A243SA75_9ACTN|nr:hypothetical protein CA983_02995 [Streptomyces swartbergensis]